MNRFKLVIKAGSWKELQENVKKASLTVVFSDQPVITVADNGKYSLEYEKLEDEVTNESAC